MALCLVSFDKLIDIPLNFKVIRKNSMLMKSKAGHLSIYD